MTYSGALFQALFISVVIGAVEVLKQKGMAGPDIRIPFIKSERGTRAFIVLCLGAAVGALWAVYSKN